MVDLMSLDPCLSRDFAKHRGLPLAAGVALPLSARHGASINSQKTVAIVFFTHTFDATTVAHLKKLKEESANCGTFFIYSDIHGENPAGVEGDIVRFDFEIIRRRYPRVLGRTLIPGNCHLTFLDFYLRHSGFEYYWMIEYDVMLTGCWQDFFAALSDLHVDFLACHLRTQEEEPGWGFWSTLESPSGQAMPAELIRAFCPIQRMSRRALELLEIKAMEGWGGHFECLVPTLLQNGGYSLADVGGDGRFVPEGFRNRFYTSFSWPDGSLLHFGSMRFRPSVVLPSPLARQKLYHPVKGHSGPFGRILARALKNLLSKIRYAAQLLRDHPLSCIRALLRHYLWSPSRARAQD
jgi:hypothetical protein